MLFHPESLYLTTGLFILLFWSQYLEWRRAITLVLGKYLCSAGGQLYMKMDLGCPGPGESMGTQPHLRHSGIVTLFRDNSCRKWFTLWPESFFIPSDQPKLSELGTLCPDISIEAANKILGVYTAPWESIDDIATYSLLHGICTIPMHNNTESFAHWIAKVGSGCPST